VPSWELELGCKERALVWCRAYGAPTAGQGGSSSGLIPSPSGLGLMFCGRPSGPRNHLGVTLNQIFQWQYYDFY
jgi:hypothetical protein